MKWGRSFIYLWINLFAVGNIPKYNTIKRYKSIVRIGTNIISIREHTF